MTFLDKCCIRQNLRISQLWFYPVSRCKILTATVVSILYFFCQSLSLWLFIFCNWGYSFLFADTFLSYPVFRYKMYCFSFPQSYLIFSLVFISSVAYFCLFMTFVNWVTGISKSVRQNQGM